jgi:D-3-phosphoglycerate dehydrogenase
MTSPAEHEAQRQRVVLVDAAGDVEAVAAALAGIANVVVERAERLPSGPGIVALLIAGEQLAVGARELRSLPDLQIVAATSTGYDHLDLDALAAAGIWATHCPGYCDEEVAEHTLALALDLLRGVTLLDRAVHGGCWDHMLAPPRRIAGAVIGVVGLGRIGRRVAQLASALQMPVLASDPAVTATDEPGVTIVAFDDLLRGADVVTLHAPLTAGTRGLIGARELAIMRPGSFLVNCARSALVDHQALGDALRSGHLGGCALDVLPAEPPAVGEPALSWPRTLITPHAAWYSPETARAPYRLAGEAVAAVLSGREPAAGTLVRPAVRHAATGAARASRNASHTIR